MSNGQDRFALSGKSIPPFAALKAFEAVGRVGGIRRAAALLDLDHTVVSRHLKTLEQWLGVQLVQRRNGAIELTKPGREYHERVSRAILDIAFATREIMVPETSDALQVWCVPGFATQWLSERIAIFERLNPGARVELRPTDTPARLLDFEADVDIRYYGDDWPPTSGGAGLHDHQLARPPLMVVTSRGFAEKLGNISGPADLLAVPLLHEEHFEQWRAWLSKNGVQAGDEALSGPLLWHAHLAIAAARQGRGVALANRYLVSEDLKAGHLVELTIPGARSVAIGSYNFVSRANQAGTSSIVRLRRFLSDQAAT